MRRKCEKELLNVRGRSLVAAILIGILLTGCGSATSDNKGAAPEEMGYAKEEYAEEEFVETESAPLESNGSLEVKDTNRKLIKTVDMTVETREYDTLMASLTEQIREFDGYVENMNTYNGSMYSSYRSDRSADMTLRIPQDKLDEFLNRVSDISNVVRRSDRVEDVTLQYVDLSSHKEALQTEQTRLLELLEQAESIEDIIVIEERLSKVRYQIESMESQLRTYDNKVSYSTVYLRIEEVRELTPVEEETVWQRIAGGFSDSMERLGEGLENFFVWVVVNSPFLILWAVVLTVLILIIKKRRLKKKIRKAAQAQPQPTDGGEKND